MVIIGFHIQLLRYFNSHVVATFGKAKSLKLVNFQHVYNGYTQKRSKKDTNQNLNSRYSFLRRAFKGINKFYQKLRQKTPVLFNISTNWLTQCQKYNRTETNLEGQNFGKLEQVHVSWKSIFPDPPLPFCSKIA